MGGGGGWGLSRAVGVNFNSGRLRSFSLHRALSPSHATQLHTYRDLPDGTARGEGALNWSDFTATLYANDYIYIYIK